jgi:hypothetical protein
VPPESGRRTVGARQRRLALAKRQPDAAPDDPRRSLIVRSANTHSRAAEPFPEPRSQRSGAGRDTGLGVRGQHRARPPAEGTVQRGRLRGDGRAPPPGACSLPPGCWRRCAHLSIGQPGGSPEGRRKAPLSCCDASSQRHPLTRQRLYRHGRRERHPGAVGLTEFGVQCLCADREGLPGEPEGGLWARSRAVIWSRWRFGKDGGGGRVAALGAVGVPRLERCAA